MHSTLDARLAAAITDRAVDFTFTVTNIGASSVTLEFASAQQFDVLVRDARGAEVWRWSADRMFAQMLTARTLAPGERVTYSARWPHAPAGAYTAEAILTSVSHAATATAGLVVR